MLGKYLDLSKLRSQNQRYERLLSKKSHLLALDPERPGKGAGYYNIVREALEAFHRYGSNLSIATHALRRYVWAMSKMHYSEV